MKYLVSALLIGMTSLSAQAADSSCTEIKDFGNGVYRFNCGGDMYAKAISDFLAQHPEYEVSSQAPAYGSTAFGTFNPGTFIVTFRERSK